MHVSDPGAMCVNEHGERRKTKHDCSWWTQNMGKEGCTGRARLVILCVEVCYMLKYAIYVGLGFFFPPQGKNN